MIVAEYVELRKFYVPEVPNVQQNKTEKNKKIRTK